MQTDTKPSLPQSRSAHSFLLLPFLALFPVCVFAQDEAADSNALRLPHVEVVETPLASLPQVDSFAASSTVITSQQLTDLNPLDFASALRRTPGVTISRYNQVGAFGGSEGGALFLRGLGSSRPGGEIKTTVDGVPKLNGVFNHPLLDLMSVDLASRVEVHARATPLEAGNAFASVNVTTPRVEKPGIIARTHLAAGSFGTVIERVDAGLREGPFDIYASQSLRRSDGHRPNSEGRLENYYLNLGWAPAPGWDFTYKLNHTSNLATDPGADLTAFPNITALPTSGETYSTSDWLQIATLAHHFGSVDGFLKAYHNAGEGNWLRRQYSGSADSLNDWLNQGLRWRESVRPWAGGEFLFGADLDFNRGTSESVPAVSIAVYPPPRFVFGPKATRLFSPYAGFSQSVSLRNGLTLTPSAGLRFYDHSEFDNRWAPQAGLTFGNASTRLHAAVSRAINFPGLEVQAFSGLTLPALGQSWRSLDAERVDQFEIGINHALTRTTVIAVTAFRNEARNRYVIVTTPPPPRYRNVEAYRTDGFEAEVQSSFSPDFAVFAGCSFLRATPGDLPYAPKHTLTSGINWRIAPGWFLSADCVYVSSMHIESNTRFANAANTSQVGAHFLLNARLAYRFSWGGASDRHQCEFYVSGENLTDRDFAYRIGYPIPGASALAGVRFEW